MKIFDAGVFKNKKKAQTTILYADFSQLIPVDDPKERKKREKRKKKRNENETK